MRGEVAGTRLPALKNAQYSEAAREGDADTAVPTAPPSARE